MKRLAAGLVALALTSAIAATAASASAAENETTHEYLVLMRGNSVSAQTLSDLEAAGGTIERTIPQVGLATVSGGADFAAAASSVRGVRSVSLNAVVDWIPNDGPQVELMALPPNSGSADPLFDLQWGHVAVDAVPAWDAGNRGAGATVAVLDTGFDLTHPDLAPQIAGSANLTSQGDDASYTLDDVFSHGTHVAGTVAAAENDFGVIGVAPDAQLLLGKVLHDEGSGSFADVIAGLVWAADSDADIINMSLGATVSRNGFWDLGDPDDPDDEDVFVTAREVSELLTAMDRATTYAHRSGSLVIASAGNEETDLDKSPAVVKTPAASPHVLAISATGPIGWAVDPDTFLDHLAPYSNFGTSLIDAAAPGGNFVYPGEEDCTVAGLTRPCWVFDLVFSTGNGGWYWSAGTSMAAPHASGVAAIIVGKHGGDMKPSQLARALLGSADDLGKPGVDPIYGHGRVNAHN